MFKNDENYKFFMRRLYYYILPVADLYSYCLLPNHFHLFIKIKNLSHLKKDQDTSDHEIVSPQFRKLFQSYALSFNNRESRVGSLFQSPFKRSLVDNEFYFLYLIFYIHSNPQKHKIVSDFRTWKWSSYNEIITNSRTPIPREKIFEWYGGKKEFILYHNENQTWRFEDDIFLEF